MGLGAPRPDPLCAHPRGISVAWLLLGHLCQDPGVLRKPREAGATELGGSVPFHPHIGLRLKTKLSDFRTFHSSKNNCTWGKTCRHFSKSSSRFNKVPKASGVDRLRFATHQRRLPCQPRLLRPQDARAPKPHHRRGDEGHTAEPPSLDPTECPPRTRTLSSLGKDAEPRQRRQGRQWTSPWPCSGRSLFTASPGLHSPLAGRVSPVHRWVPRSREGHAIPSWAHAHPARSRDSQIPQWPGAAV